MFKTFDYNGHYEAYMDDAKFTIQLSKNKAKYKDVDVFKGNFEAALKAFKYMKVNRGETKRLTFRSLSDKKLVLDKEEGWNE